MLEASSFHPGRTARNHLRVYAAASGIPDAAPTRCSSQVGLTDAAKRKVRGYSLGMRQRLGLAFALLGNPQVLLLDEPANGLDPEGIRWLRGFQRALADEGRTVLVSSHLLTEVQQSADRVVILSQGRLVREGSMDELERGAGETVVVSTPTVDKLGSVLAAAGATVSRSGPTSCGCRAWTRPPSGTRRSSRRRAARAADRAGRPRAAVLQLTEGEFHGPGRRAARRHAAGGLPEPRPDRRDAARDAPGRPDRARPGGVR